MDKNKEQTINPGLYLVSTPIGNMEDITLRALKVLKKSDIILCEDTRRSGKLLSRFKIKSKLLSYHKFNEKKISGQVINYIKEGKIISLISDAGTPAISDPGSIVINSCFREGVNICPIPGPSAVTSAVSVSGFSDQYIFYGFLTKKEKELESILSNLSSLKYSIVFFIPALKINFYLSKFKRYFSHRKILIAKEMTKIHEKFFRGDLSSIKKLPEDLKGELTVILSEENKEKSVKREIDESVKMEIRRMLQKYSLKDVVEFIRKRDNLPKKKIYELCLKMK